MAAKLAIGTETRERLFRLSVVFAVEIRLKIVAELYKQEMSPKQFYEEFGGGSIARVTHNFERLADAGWLRYVRSEGPGGARRGGVERFYRSTELAFFDVDTWSLVPYSVRVACSWSLFNQIALRLRQTLEGSRPDSKRRDLTRTRLLLDEVGWKRVIEALDAQFTCIFEEQTDARLRANAANEPLLQADILLIAFETPLQGKGRQSGSSLVETQREPLAPFPERLSSILADEICREIVNQLNGRAMSPTQFHREFGGASVGRIHRRFSKLEANGWLKKVKEETGGLRRGATENYYHATRPGIADKDIWTIPPASLNGTPTWRTFACFCNDVNKAMRAGTFDARLDRYVTLSFLSLDAEGWTNVIAGIESLQEIIVTEQEHAKQRMEKSRVKPIAMTVGLGAFETLKETKKAP